MPTSTRLVPDFQYYCNSFIMNTVLNKNLIPFSTPIDRYYLDEDKSFINLLFNDEWPTYLLYYRYLYRKELISACPGGLRIRLMIYPATAEYFVCDSDDTSICNLNLFNLKPDDFTMLDYLLQYRIDSTCTITIDYNDLTTPLSKLIYIYLTVKLTGDYSLYDNDTIISPPDKVLENFYELYVIETIFNTVSDKGI